jgi:ABC-type antimicrobial peptide transport system permease subunit
MFTAFGLLALAIAALGLYAVTAYGVAQRTQEIGVRMALGAAGGSVIRLVVTQSLGATAAGVLAGVVIALGLGRAVSALLFDVRPADAASVGGAIAVLLVVAAAAAWLPARRAASIDPMVALRSE